MKLITEQTENVSNTIVENKNGELDHFIEGIFIQAEQKNRNGRIYPRSVINGPVKEYIEQYVKTGRAVGELNHPSGPEINLDKVSHVITELAWDGDNVIGKAKILGTPMGNIVKELLNGGCKLGVSTRGLGSVKENNGTMMVTEFQLKTVDIVQDPSAPSAFVNGIMEGVEFTKSGELDMSEKIVYESIAEGADLAKKYLSSISVAQIEEQKAKVFADFLSGIKF